MSTQEKLSHKLYLAKKVWAELDCEVSILEHRRKIILSVIIIDTHEHYPKMSMGLAEHHAYSTTEYQEFINEMTKARMKANIKLAEVEAIKEAIKESEREDIKSAMEMKYSNVNGFGG